MVVALKPRNPVLKPRTKFRLKFVRDLNAKTNLSYFLAAVLFRDLSTKHTADSGIYVQHRDPPGHIPGIECSVTLAFEIVIKHFTASYSAARAALL